MHDSHDHDPSEIFAKLKDRPTPELDSAGAWSRLRAQLGAGRQQQPATGVIGRWPRPLGWAGMATAAAAVAVLGLVLGWWPPTQSADPVREMVLLAEPPAAGDPASQASPEAQRYSLEFRLVRGYTGEAPAAALDEAALGAGGASLRADLEPTLRALDPDRKHAIIGAWAGDPETAAAAGVGLSAEFALHFRIEPAIDGLRLRDVELLGVEPPLVADQMLLSPGHLYVFGVRGSEAGTSDLVLAVRLRPQPDPAPGAPRDD